MNEEELQLKRRENEEQATAGRARILGLPYLDTRDFEDEIPLVPDLLEKQQMHQDFIIPLQNILRPEEVANTWYLLAMSRFTYIIQSHSTI